MSFNKNVLYSFIAVLATGILGFALGRNTDLQFKITGPGGHSAALTVAGGAIDHEEVMKKMFSDSFVASGVRDWLASNRKMASVRDVRLAGMIEQYACDSIPAEPLQDYLDALRTCAERPENRSLRDLALSRKGYPFHVVGVPLRVSVPEKMNWPDAENASICRDSPMFGTRIELVNPQRNTSIFVDATGSIPCSKIAGVGTQLHLHPDASRKLFGRTATGRDTVYALAGE